MSPRSVRDVLFVVAVVCVGFLGCRSRIERPNVLVVTLDTTRKDHLGFYGYGRATSPNLDTLAESSVVFTRAVAASSWTLPSHASIFTGKFPTSHGARYDPEGPLRLSQAIAGPEEWDGYRASPLSPAETTLAAILREAGYRTGAVVGGPWMKRVFGLSQGFERYDDDGIVDVNGKLASEVTSSALSFLEECDGKPFFLFLNYFDPHGPYDAPAPFRGTFGNEPSDRYDEEILYMDHHLGRLLAGMKTLGVFEKTLIVVTADHGELLGEHGKMGHGATLFEEEIRVPFLVKYPGSERPPARTDDGVHHVDVLPMVLDRLGLPVPRGIQGGVPPTRERPLIAEVDPLPFMSAEGSFRALYLGRYKLLWNGLGESALYDIEADGNEHKDLSASEPGRTSNAVALLEKYLASLPPPGDTAQPTTLDEATLEALRKLGYVP